MILTQNLLITQYARWFHGKRNVEQAKEEILNIFSEEPNNGQEWTEQDICEQSRKIHCPLG